jgi:hypothetical protein
MYVFILYIFTAGFSLLEGCHDAVNHAGKPWMCVKVAGVALVCRYAIFLFLVKLAEKRQKCP